MLPWFLQVENSSQVGARRSPYGRSVAASAGQAPAVAIVSLVVVSLCLAPFSFDFVLV